MGANRSKYISNASLGEIGPYRVSQKYIFSPKVKCGHFHHYQKISSPENFSLYKVGHMGDNGSEYISKASLGGIGPYRVSKNIYFWPKVKYGHFHHYSKISSPKNLSLYKGEHTGANGSKCIAKTSLGEIGPYRVSQKYISSPKVKYGNFQHYQKISSPENFSLYKVGHMGANGSKYISKASLGEIGPYRVSQKYIFSPKVKYSHYAPLSENRLS
jgi:hypothetical protein